MSLEWPQSRVIKKGPGASLCGEEWPLFMAEYLEKRSWLFVQLVQISDLFRGKLNNVEIRDVYDNVAVVLAANK